LLRSCGAATVQCAFPPLLLDGVPFRLRLPVWLRGATFGARPLRRLGSALLLMPLHGAASLRLRLRSGAAVLLRLSLAALLLRRL
jgi:hypothetical protein